MARNRRQRTHSSSTRSRLRVVHCLVARPRLFFVRGLTTKTGKEVTSALLTAIAALNSTSGGRTTVILHTVKRRLVCYNAANDMLVGLAMFNTRTRRHAPQANERAIRCAGILKYNGYALFTSCRATSHVLVLDSHANCLYSESARSGSQVAYWRAHVL